MSNNLMVTKKEIELDGQKREIQEATFGAIIDLGGLAGPFVDAYNDGLKSGTSDLALYLKVLSVNPKLFLKGMEIASGMKGEYIRGLSKDSGFKLFMALLEVNGLMGQEVEADAKGGKSQESQ